MKLGILISSIMVIAITLVLIFTLRGVPEEPTTATRAENLALRTELNDLPKIYEEKGGDAWNEYQAIFQFYRDNRANIDTLLQELTSYTGDTPPEPPAEISEKAIDLFIAAHEAGTVSASQLDGTTKIWPNAPPDIASPESVALLAALRAFWLYHEAPGQKERAEKACRAIWAVGQTMFTKSNRVMIRTTGLEIIKASAEQMYNWTEDGSELGAHMYAWTDALNKFEEYYWIPKTQIVYELKPNVGDLLNVALHDKDLSWKLEATLALGRIKWNARTKGNKNAILRAISTLKGSSDPMIREAALVAEKFAVDDLKSLN